MNNVDPNPTCANTVPTVRVDGLHTSGSPYKVEVSAGPARGANATVSGSALSLATAGENASFVIQARDKEANPADGESGISNILGGGQETIFNVTLRRNGDVPGSEEVGDMDNSTTVKALVEYIGE